VENEMKKSAKKPEADCGDCGTTVRRIRENHHMPLVADWGVTLEGAEIIHCARCGRRGVSIENMGPLMRGIAAAVVGKRGRLAAPEVTFLRKHLGYTGARLAKALGVTGPSVSRWETGREPIGPSADRLLRALVLMHDRRADHFDLAQFEAIEDGMGPVRLTLRRDAKGNWAAAA
jgi:putative zinc finger/helix-turn-helix YgiT family protein